MKEARTSQPIKQLVSKSTTESSICPCFSLVIQTTGHPQVRGNGHSLLHGKLFQRFPPCPFLCPSARSCRFPWCHQSAPAALSADTQHKGSTNQCQVMQNTKAPPISVSWQYKGSTNQCQVMHNTKDLPISTGCPVSWQPPPPPLQPPPCHPGPPPLNRS